MAKSLNILFLNCKSLNCKLGEVKLLIYSEKPAICCFNETWMKKKFEPNFIGYSAIWNNREDGYGGVGILISQEYNYSEIKLNLYDGGVLEVMAVNAVMKTGELMSILNCYNPNEKVTIGEVRHYIQQLARNYVIVGDLNALTSVLDTNCIRSNATGRMLETLLTEDQICLINPRNMYTYISFSNLKKSCLDICLTSPNIAPLTAIERKRDIGSDHFPVKVTVNLAPAIQIIKIQKRWIFENVKWNEWRNSIPKLTEMLPDSVDNMSEKITNRILYASHKNIKETSGIFNPNKRSSWWSEDISKKVAERRRAKKLLEQHPLLANLQEYRNKSNIARNAIKEAKAAEWQKYVNDIKSDTPMKEVWTKIKSVKKRQCMISIPLVQNNTILSSGREKANCLAHHFYSTMNDSQLFREEEYKQVIDAHIWLPDESDGSITMVELARCIQSLKITSPGMDKLSSKFLKELPVCIMEELLYL